MHVLRFSIYVPFSFVKQWSCKRYTECLKWKAPITLNNGMVEKNDAPQKCTSILPRNKIVNTFRYHTNALMRVNTPFIKLWKAPTSNVVKSTVTKRWCKYNNVFLFYIKLNLKMEIPKYQYKKDIIEENSVDIKHVHKHMK